MRIYVYSFFINYVIICYNLKLTKYIDINIYIYIYINILNSIQDWNMEVIRKLSKLKPLYIRRILYYIHTMKHIHHSRAS